jgi:hypothetical protein
MGSFAGQQESATMSGVRMLVYATTTLTQRAHQRKPLRQRKDWQNRDWLCDF